MHACTFIDSLNFSERYAYIQYIYICTYICVLCVLEDFWIHIQEAEVLSVMLPKEYDHIQLAAKHPKLCTISFYSRFISDFFHNQSINTCMHAYIRDIHAHLLIVRFSKDMYICVWNVYNIYVCILYIQFIYIIYTSQCQNYRTEPGVQKCGKIPYLRTPPDPDSARLRKIPYLRTPPDPHSARIRTRSIILFPRKVWKKKCIWIYSYLFSSFYNSCRSAVVL